MAFRPWLVVVAVALAPVALAVRPLTVEDLLATRRPSEPQISPDGKWVAFTVRQKSLSENRDLRDVWLQPLPSGPARQFTRDGKSDHPRWSPNGQQLLIGSSRGDDGTQLYLYDLPSGGDARKLTALKGGAEGGVWSPDGKWVAFTSDVFPECKGGGAAIDACNRKKTEELAGTKVKARIVDHLFARHWMDWKEGKRTHVFALSLAVGAEARDLTPGDSDWPTWRLGGEEPAFTPDGAELIVSAKPATREAWSTNGDLWAISLAAQGNAAPRNLTAANTGDDASPKLSPDGKWIAYRAQALDGFEADQWKLMLLERKTGKTTLLGDFDDDAESFVWRRDGKGLVVAVPRHGRNFLRAVPVGGALGPKGAAVAAFAEAAAGGDFDVAPDGAVVVVRSSLTRPPELFRLPAGGAPVALTSLNQETFAAVDLSAMVTEQWVTAADGAKVHSWVIQPPGLKAGQKVPLVALIHGGPQGAWEDGWGMRWNPLPYVARGWAVVMPNPRGSTGYGHAFELGVSKDWGGKPYDDIMKSVDAAVALPFVDAKRTCAAGASYGGYMVNWIAGHTDRFRCLVTHDGVYDLVSMYGSTEELWFPEFELGGPYWEQPEAYKKWSPSSYAGNFKTPTLVVQGELDFRVATEQGLGMFTALQRRGVESRLLWFPDEGHWVNKPRNSALWYRTVLDWIDGHVRP